MLRPHAALLRPAYAALCDNRLKDGVFPVLIAGGVLGAPLGARPDPFHVILLKTGILSP